jgi:hypothetical protein
MMAGCNAKHSLKGLHVGGWASFNMPTATNANLGKEVADASHDENICPLYASFCNLW